MCSLKFESLSGKKSHMKPTKTPCWFIFAVGVPFFFLLVRPTSARKAFIKDIKTEIKQNYLFISFRVTDCFTEKMIQAIKNGVDTRFVYLVRFYRVRKWWKDKKIVDMKISHTLYYDSIKKVYNLRLSEGNPKEFPVKDLEDAKRMLARITNLRIIDVKKLKKGEKYQIRVKAELDKIRLPLHLHYVLFFLSLWNFDTDWYKIDFTYR